ncbi:bestrophin family protein [Pokkaliibacter sp. CJK22405]|uniref:bestrophin family protein n=1 Tax=Pokkaliibacter sp. CJK22405 TaxID=3384615 RepID=UPI0039851964
MIIHDQKPSLLELLFAFKGTIISVIWPKVLFTVLLSSLVVMTHGTLYDYKLVLTATPFTLWGLTLAIFLGFRNTVAYQRFWEARTLWGEVLVVARNLTRQTLTLLPNLSRAEQQSLAYRVAAFAYVIRDHQRGLPLGAEAQALLPATEITELKASDNAPNLLLLRIGAAFTSACRAQGADSIVMTTIDQQVNRLSNMHGGCERIKSTPIPYPYILMLHRFVHIYCFLLPFCLVDSIGWLTPFVVCVLAYTFFGLDALGDQISDPFDAQPNDLALDAMSRNIEINVRMLLGEKDLPTAIEAKDGVLL